MTTIVAPSIAPSTSARGSVEPVGVTELLMPSIVGLAICPTELLSRASCRSSSTSDSRSRISKFCDSILASPLTLAIGETMGSRKSRTISRVCE